MRLGMMNNPTQNALDEARWAAAHGFDFLDLTIEGPAADIHQIDAPAIRQVLAEAGMGVVGHTAWFLPFASPVERVRRAAVEEVTAAFPLFAEVGATLVNVHITKGVGSFGHASMVRLNGASFAVHRYEQRDSFEVESTWRPSGHSDHRRRHRTNARSGCARTCA